MLRFVLHIILTISILTWVNYRYNRRTVPVTDDGVLKEVIPLTRMEHTSVVEGKLERLTPKKQESVLRMLDVIIEEMMK